MNEDARLHLAFSPEAWKQAVEAAVDALNPSTAIAPEEDAATPEQMSSRDAWLLKMDFVLRAAMAALMPSIGIPSVPSRLGPGVAVRSEDPLVLRFSGLREKKKS